MGEDVAMPRILVTEEITQSGLDLLRDAGHVVDVQLGLSPVELLDAVNGASALIIRSATTVTRELLVAGQSLAVIGRAGVGLDNVDVDAATKRGVMVVNAPQSNIVSTAEQTMGLILALARNIPQAGAALKAGRWERSTWTGTELQGKTLGIVGLGRVGALVAERALAFGMHIVAHDPFVSDERARQLSAEPMSLEDLAACSDIVTTHVIKTPETIGLIGEDFLAKAKPGIRIINVARGGIVDEEALLAGLESGRVGGAALDVFASEPMTDSPLFDLPNVVVTPHLGASTHEAQLKAGVTIAEQVGLALAGDFVPFAVNVEAAEVAETIRPFLPLATQLGALFGGLFGSADQLPSKIDLAFEGQIGGYDNRLVTLAAAKSMLEPLLDQPVSFVNVRKLLAANGIEFNATPTTASEDYVNRLVISGGGRQLAATLIGLAQRPRIVAVDSVGVEVPPSDNMLIIRNDDRPGMIGKVGAILGEAGINIDHMGVGRDQADATALMVLDTCQLVDDQTLAALEQAEGILTVDRIAISQQ